MSCVPSSHCSVFPAVLVGAFLAGWSALSAQVLGAASSGSSIASGTSRAPVITLTTPPAGGTVPRDRPVVVFRVAAGDPANPLDFLSFAVVMDGRDRTAGFRLTGGEAWGSLAGPPSDGHAAELIADGAHEVTGRICSLRGICGSTSATVTVTPPLTPIDGSPAGASPPPKSRGLPGALSGAIRWVIGA